MAASFADAQEARCGRCGGWVKGSGVGWDVAITSVRRSGQGISEGKGSGAEGNGGDSAEVAHRASIKQELRPGGGEEAHHVAIKKELHLGGGQKEEAEGQEGTAAGGGGGGAAGHEGTTAELALRDDMALVASGDKGVHESIARRLLAEFGEMTEERAARKRALQSSSSRSSSEPGEEKKKKKKGSKKEGRGKAKAKAKAEAKAAPAPAPQPQPKAEAKAAPPHAQLPELQAKAKTKAKAGAPQAPEPQAKAKAGAPAQAPEPKAKARAGAPPALRMRKHRIITNERSRCQFLARTGGHGKGSSKRFVYNENDEESIRSAKEAAEKWIADHEEYVE